MFFLTCGYLRAPAWPLCPGARGKIDLPMAVAVVPRPGDTYLLLDCGFSQIELEAPKRRLLPTSLLFQFQGGDPALGGRPPSIAEQLAARGIPATAVRHIVATHLHLDHVGGFVDFPNAEILAAAGEVAANARSGALRGYQHGKALQRSGRLVPAELAGGERHGFPAHLDLFGDGQVVLLDARGHTEGSVAVLLTDGGRTVLHAGDAAYAPLEYREARQSFFSKVVAFRKDWLQTTWGHLRDFEAGGGEVLLAHDPVAFARISVSP